MIDHIEVGQGTILVHLAEVSLMTTKSFTHGGIRFDAPAGLVTFGSLPPVSIPEELDLADGATLNLQLIGPDGEPRKQSRTGILHKVKDAEIYRVPGLSKTPARFTANDGWGHEVYKYRAYYTHPGLTTTGEIPKWLQESIGRQRAFWNRLAWLCREARRKCSPDATEEVKRFVGEVILPAIDVMNESLGRSSLKLKHPKKLKIEEPNVDGLYSLLGVLRSRVEKGKPVPDGLLDQVVEFAQRFKADYKPINDFLNNVLKIAKKETTDLGLAWYESGPMLTRFMAVLKARKTTKAGWSEGWPFLKYPDSPGAANWSFTYRLNQAGLLSGGLDKGKVVGNLCFGEAKPPTETGHPNLHGDAARNKLREATVTLRGEDRQPMGFRFGVLEHRPLPESSHLKQWQLAEIDGKLWLNLTLEVKHETLKAPTEAAAGLDIGWRRTEEGIRIGVLHEPVSGTYREILLDFQRSPKDNTERVPFRLDLGPTRWERRNITSIIPDWKPGDVLPGTVVLRDVLAKRRSALKDTAKATLREHLGGVVPPWFDKAGKRGLLKLAEDLKDDSIVQKIASEFSAQTDALNRLTSSYFEQSTRRVEYGYQQIAHDVVKLVKSKGMNRIMIEAGFLTQLTKLPPDPESDGYYALQNSQKYRQFAAVGKFITILEMIAGKYGIVVEEKDAANTTRLCSECGCLNQATHKQEYECEGCHRTIDQDYNAAANLSEAPAVRETVESAA